MNRKDHITGIILAGGKSTRMGRDKALLPFRGKLFIEHLMDALNPLVTDIMVVSDDTNYDRFKATRVEDIVKDAGPLAGIYSGLSHSQTENNIVLSCDVPLVDTKLLQRLITENEPSVDVVQFQTKDNTMPLIALYKKRCMGTCLALLNSGERRLQSLAGELNSKTILLGEDKEYQTVNINTEQDLNLLRNEFDH